jgi:hypothetical protein
VVVLLQRCGELRRRYLSTGDADALTSSLHLANTVLRANAGSGAAHRAHLTGILGNRPSVAPVQASSAARARGSTRPNRGPTRTQKRSSSVNH